MTWAENLVGSIPLPLLETWGKFAYLVGTVLAICAYAGFTFRAGGGWKLGRERSRWGLRAVLAIPITFLVVVLSGFLGSFFVLVPGAQTFEVIKDMAVFLCLLYFGYPALLTTPLAYGLSDIIEGVAIENILDWGHGYLINPAFFWLGCQFLGRDPDFRKWKTWPPYLAFVTLFLACQPIFWGFVCAGGLSPELSYGKVVPALTLTMLSTWLLTPFATLVTYPLVKKVGYYWAEIPYRVQQKAWSSDEWEWVKTDGPSSSSVVPIGSIPVRMFLLTPFAALMLLMLAVMASVTLKGAQQDIDGLAHQLHREYAANIGHQLDGLLRKRGVDALQREDLSEFLKDLEIAQDSRILILSAGQKVVGSTTVETDAVTEAVIKYVRDHPGQAQIGSFALEKVNPRSLERETWLGYRTRYTLSDRERTRWTVITIMPESYYLQGVRTSHSRAATLFGIALLSSLAVALVLSGVVTSQLRDLSFTAARLASGDLTQRVSVSRFFRLREIEVLAHSLDAMAGKLEGSFSDLLTEVKQRRTAERELLTHQDGLEELVRVRTHELSRAVERGEAASQSKGRFLALMGHELRTPLNAILGYSQLLIRDSEVAPAQKAHLQAIHSSGEHLLRLVNDVLEMSRIEAGQRVLTLETFNPKVLVGEVVDMFGPEALAAGINLTEGFGVGIPLAVDQDAGKVRQVLINLLDNAFKFTQCGYIRIRCYTRVGEEGRGSSLVVEVEDSGCGIAESDLELIFESFTQLEDGVRVGGVGLGLAICQSFAEQMGGTIEAESVVGQGSTFRLIVPVGKRGSLPRESAYSAGERSKELRIPKVLIINDSQVNKVLFSSLFTSQDFEVKQVGKNDDVVSVVKVWAPDLVVLDLQGCREECLSSIPRLKEIDSKISLLAIDFSEVPGGREAALEAGADAVLAGLVECSAILEQVDALLGRREFADSPEVQLWESNGRGADKSLAEELSRLPEDLLERLRSAALEARSQTLNKLLSEVGKYSPGAVPELESMIERFGYAELIEALPHHSASESERE